ncbi:MAG: oligosaccharide flippase family protein [Methanomassiliicoccales archaeon]|nr:oligosaccharide flippase family protein [Methanomassiliicoccales archaeon]
MARPTMILFTATFIGGAANYLYQILMGRALGTEDYSALTALLSIFYILSVPVQTIGTAIARYVSRFMAEGQEGQIAWLMSRAFWASAALGGAMAIGLFLLSPQLVSFMSLSSWLPIFILMAGIVVTMVGPVGTGTLQGLQRFGALSAFNLVGPLGKLAFGIILVMAGMGVSGAFGGVMVGGLLAVILVFYAMRDHIKIERIAFPTRPILVYLVPVTIGMLCFTVITNVDTFLARNFFSYYDASLYSAASMLGKISLWLPAAVSLVMFSKVSEAHSQKKRTIGIMRRSIMYVLMLGGITALGFFLFPELTLDLLYGAQYVPAAPVLRIMGVAMFFLCLAQLFLFYGLATDHYAYIIILSVFTVFQLLIMTMFHSDIVQFAMVILISAISICFISWAYMEVQLLRKDRGRGDEDRDEGFTPPQL